jgi:hypothetical protein
MTYYPTIFFNEFWTLRENLIPINETLKEATIALDLTQMGLWKFTIFSQVEKSFEMQVWQAPGSAHSRSSSHQACTSLQHRLVAIVILHHAVWRLMYPLPCPVLAAFAVEGEKGTSEACPPPVHEGNIAAESKMLLCRGTLARKRMGRVMS